MHSEEISQRQTGDHLKAHQEQASKQQPANNNNSEQKLSAENLDLEIFFELSSDLLCITKNGYIQRINAAFSASLGYSEQDLIGKPFISFIHPEDQPQTRQKLDLQTAGQTACTENRYLCKDGIYKLIAWKNRSHPQTGLTYRVGKDISVEQQAKQTLDNAHHSLSQQLGRATDLLSNAQQEYHQLLETSVRQLAELESIYTNAPIGLSLVDINFRFLRINSRLAEINGYSAEFHIGRSFREIIPDLAEKIEPLYQQVIETKQPIFNQEIHGTTPAQPGVERNWLINYYPLFNSEGEVISISAIVQEITERKTAEAALRQSEQKFKLALNNIPDTFVIYDAQRRYQFVNAAGLERSQKTLAELRGRTDEEVWPPEITHSYIHALHQAFETRTIQQGENTFILPNSQPFTLSLKYVPLLNEKGEIEQVLGFTFDISERKHYEEEILKINAELETRVQQRTAELQSANNWLTGIINSNNDIIAALDTNFNFIAFNQAYQKEFKTIFGVDIQIGVNLTL